MNRIKYAVIFMLACFMLSSCGLYDKEYISISDFVQEQRQETSNGEVIAVSNINELESAVITIISNYSESNSILFDTDYSGDPAADISSVCRKIIQHNPLCAYCVENISYNLYNVPGRYEANIIVTFAEGTVSIGDIISLNYGGEMKSVVSSAMKNGDEKIAVLVKKSGLSADDIIKTCQETYYSDPLSFPAEPAISVNMYSDNASSRLYELLIDYGVDEYEYTEFRESVGKLSLFEDMPDDTPELEKVFRAVTYLTTNCTVSENRSDNTAYSAICYGTADSEGLSLALVALCRRCGVDCKIVKGQRDWVNHYWNIAKIEGYYYHIDMVQCIKEDLMSGFLLNDDRMWNTYRWDLSGYPQCNGPITYSSNLFSDSSVIDSEEANEFVE